jgi:membrane fusion protein (multidrug efflux system)
MKANRKLWVIVLGGLVLVVLLLVGVKAKQIVTMVRAGESMAPPPETVSAAKVERVEWVASRPGIATLFADRGVILGAELPGTVREITFSAGANVRKGQVLVRLDVSAERAQLESAQAEAALTDINLERARTLRRDASSAQADLDTAEARAKQAHAAVASREATIAKKTIRAPFDGRISIRQVELGQVLAPGTAVASLQTVTPIHAEFWLPQQAFADLRPGQKTRLTVDAFPDARWDGEITVVNPEVDASTRNVRVRATLQNADGRLRPGMFGNVELFAREARPQLIIPATAVIFAPYGDSVFAIEEKKDEKTGRTAPIARQKFVRLGDRRGDYVAVVSGLEAGETVVSRGAFKLRNGMPIAVSDAKGTEPELQPTPKDD